ncbi:MAG: hypothetical protein JWM59_2325 [Verrucomicrobiales bacterium]|nr:hypothetical protein [Verrucomicrobiales bacterium]
MKPTQLFCSLALLAFALPSQAQEAAPAAAKPKAVAAEPAAEKENTAEVAEKAGDKAKATVKKTKETKETKAAAKTLPFYGEVAAVDEAAKTIKIAENTYHVTDATVIHDGDNAAKFSDVKAGRKIGGSYITTAGKKELVKLNLGVKQEAGKRAPKEKEKEKAKSEAKTKPAAPAAEPSAPSDSTVPASDGKKKSS